VTVAIHELHDLRADLRRTRETYGRGSSHTQAAFERLVRAAAASGQPLDALRLNSKIESERFFARTVPGPEGHVYWTAGKSFRKNDGGYVVPRRWWWQRLHGPISHYLDVVATCGERACINPEHCETGRDVLRQGFPQRRLITALQIAAFRLGYSPTQTEWIKRRLRPMPSVFKLRFGSWDKALEAAGLGPVTRDVPHYSDEQYLDALRYTQTQIGHIPTRTEYEAVRNAARGHRDMPAYASFQKRFGAWSEAVRRAGARTGDHQ